jgi:hypothetical protein
MLQECSKSSPFGVASLYALGSCTSEQKKVAPVSKFQQKALIINFIKLNTKLRNINNVDLAKESTSASLGVFFSECFFTSKLMIMFNHVCSCLLFNLYICGNVPLP